MNACIFQASITSDHRKHSRLSTKYMSTHTDKRLKPKWATRVKSQSVVRAVVGVRRGSDDVVVGETIKLIAEARTKQILALGRLQDIRSRKCLLVKSPFRTDIASIGRIYSLCSVYSILQTGWPESLRKPATQVSRTPKVPLLLAG